MAGRWPSALADDSDSNPDNNAARWDIHDDLTKFEQARARLLHDRVSTPTTQDAVDNCNMPQHAVGPFSRVFGDFVAAPVGRPVRPAGAQHAAQRRQAERGRCSDARGSRGRSDRQEHRRHGHRRSGLAGAGQQVGGLQPRTAGHRDGPQLLRAVLRRRTSRPRRGPGCSSGIDGPAQGNNFRGFLVDGLYHYWDFAEVLRTEVHGRHHVPPA